MYYGTSAGKAGFLTTCYILIVPILGLLFGRKCGLNIWIGVILTLTGLYLLCINDSFTLQFGDMLVLLCAIVFSVQIMLVDHFAPLVDGVRLSFLQFLVCGIVCAVPMFIFEIDQSLIGITTWAKSFMTWNVWKPILYTGVLSCGVAYTIQIIAQKDLNPTVASLIMSLESVFSVLAGWIILKEYLTGKELIGCIIIFMAIIFAQIPMKKSKGESYS